MPHPKKVSLLFVLLAAAVIAYVFTLKENQEQVKVGQAAPAFTLPSKKGPMSLDQYRGKVVLINFWATWCPSCAQEMPSLERMKKIMEGKNFELLAISVDEKGWRAIDVFLQKIPLTMPILLDSPGDVASLYGTNRLPESYLVDKQGKIVTKYVGPRDWTEPRIISEVLRYVDTP